MAVHNGAVPHPPVPRQTDGLRAPTAPIISPLASCCNPKTRPVMARRVHLDAREMCGPRPGDSDRFGLHKSAFRPYIRCRTSAMPPVAALRVAPSSGLPGLRRPVTSPP